MSKYNQALKETKRYLPQPIGFSDYESPKEDSKVIIRQNNTILQLLVQILDKIDNKESGKEIVLATSGLIISTRSINSEKWTYLKVPLEATTHSK